VLAGGITGDDWVRDFIAAVFAAKLCSAHATDDATDTHTRLFNNSRPALRVLLMCDFI
jgi:hypothetical protein